MDLIDQCVSRTYVLEEREVLGRFRVPSDGNIFEAMEYNVFFSWDTIDINGFSILMPALNHHH